jgi:ABC-type antimicrobial peptide transport system permease subunit
MNISEYFFSSLDALRTNKLRSGLSLIGIIVGVSSVVVLVGLGNGMKEKIIKSFSATNNIISIVPGQDFMVQMASTK